VARRPQRTLHIPVEGVRAETRETRVRLKPVEVHYHRRPEATRVDEPHLDPVIEPEHQVRMGARGSSGRRSTMRPDIRGGTAPRRVPPLQSGTYLYVRER